MAIPFVFWGGIYDRIMPILDGTVKFPDLNFHYLFADQPSFRFQSLMKNAYYDGFEIGLGGSLVRGIRAEDSLLTLIPVFPVRIGARHSVLYVRQDSTLKEPRDLIGKKLGLPMYEMTAPMWFRGWLKDDYDITPEQIQWYETVTEMGAAEMRKDNPKFANVSVTRIEQGTTIQGLLESGELDAVFSATRLRDPSKLRLLFEDVKPIELNYYRQGLPINHAVAIPKRVYDKDPWVTKVLLDGFNEAKDIALDRIRMDNYPMVFWGDYELKEQQRMFGEDYWPYGFRKNKDMLKKFIGYAFDQGVIPEIFEPEEMFAENTLDT